MTGIPRHLLSLSLPDLLVLAYVLAASLAIAITRPAGEAVGWLAGFAPGVALYLLLAAQARRHPGSRLWEAAHRLATIPAIGLVYFHLRTLIPLVNPEPADPRLADLDLALFGRHLALALEDAGPDWLTEWLGVCYQTYIWSGVALILGVMVLDRRVERATHLALGILLSFVVGHMTYFAVPARGPGFFLAGSFAGPLDSGPVVAHVLASQAVGGPGWDAFPSMHTAVTLFIASWVHRWWPRLRWSIWLLAAQILVSTVWLRFHYVVDVVAGLALALGVILGGPPLLAAWQGRRTRAGETGSPW